MKYNDMYSVGLNNRSCLFDDGYFDTLEEAVEFARHRGGKYSVNITTSKRSVHLCYHSADDTFVLDTGWGWEEIPNDQLIKTVAQYV